MKTEAKRKVTIAVRNYVRLYAGRAQKFQTGSAGVPPALLQLLFALRTHRGRDARAPSHLPRAKPCATERPVFRPGAQLCFDRIVLDVLDGGCEMFRVANVAIEILFKPELPAAAQHLVRFMRSERLESVQNLRKLFACRARQQKMNMIRHHHPGR